MPSLPTDDAAVAVVVADAVLSLRGPWGRQRLQLHLDRLPHPALPGHVHLHRLAGLAERDLLLQLADVLDRLAVHRDDDVARLEPGLPGGRGLAAEVLAPPRRATSGRPT